jgi:hypothetical protein
MCAIDWPPEGPLIAEALLIVCCIEHKRALAEEGRLARIAVEYGQFTCYDFSVLDSDRHVACFSACLFLLRTNLEC